MIDVAVLIQKVNEVFAKGDKPGHAFRGNQWSKGGSRNVKNTQKPKLATAPDVMARRKRHDIDNEVLSVKSVTVANKVIGYVSKEKRSDGIRYHVIDKSGYDMMGSDYRAIEPGAMTENDAVASLMREKVGEQ